MGRDERNEIEGRGGEKSLKQNLFKGSRYRVMPLIASHSLCYSVTFDELWWPFGLHDSVGQVVHTVRMKLLPHDV